MTRYVKRPETYEAEKVDVRTCIYEDGHEMFNLLFNEYKEKE